MEPTDNVLISPETAQKLLDEVDDTMAGEPDPGRMEELRQAYANQLAWSACEPVVDYPPTGPVVNYPPTPVPEYHAAKPRSSSALHTATGVMFVVIVGVVAVVGWGVGRQSNMMVAQPTTVTAPPPPTTVTASPTTVTAPPTTVTETPTPTWTTVETPTSSPAAPLTAADQRYIDTVESSGLHIYDPPPMIALAHQECAYLAKPGATVNSAVANLLATYNKINRTMAYGIVDGAVTAYCNQYKR